MLASLAECSFPATSSQELNFLIRDRNDSEETREYMFLHFMRKNGKLQRQR